MTTPWAKLCRERIRAAPSSPPEGGTALDLALDLLALGFGLWEHDRSLIVRHPGGLALDDAQREAVRRDKELILGLLHVAPLPDFPIGWEQEWRLELDCALRRAAAMLPGPLRDELVELSREVCERMHDWLAVGLQLRDLEWRVREQSPGRELPRAEALTPWRGWVRVGGKKGEWRETEAVGDSWIEAMTALLRVKPEAESVEKVVCVEGRHPDDRKKPR